ncbi:MAG: outer membrane beta-barrel protein [Hyphomicrobiales bacterium]
MTARAQDLTPLPPARTRPGLWSTSIYGGGTMFLPANGQLEYERTGKWYDGKINFDAGYTVGGTFGYAFDDFARAELDISYTSAGLNDFKLSGQDRPVKSASLDGSMSPLAVMGNLWLGPNMTPRLGQPMPQFGSLSPYAGFGVGAAIFETSGNSKHFSFSETTVAPAWQLGAGIRWNFTPSIGIDVGYRFRGYGITTSFSNFDNLLLSNNLIVGLTYSF